MGKTPDRLVGMIGLLWTFLAGQILVLAYAGAGWAWNMLSTHEDLAELALAGLDQDIAWAVAEYAGEPDWCHLLGGLAGEKGLCSFAHQVGALRLGDALRLQGAEEAVLLWVQAAKEAYQRGDGIWTRYLGWAIHFLCDALCPVHCLKSDEHSLLFHLWYETRFANLKSWHRDCVGGTAWSLTLKDGKSVANGEDLKAWIQESVEHVRLFALTCIASERRQSPECDDDRWLNEIFTVLGQAIRWLFRYTAGFELAESSESPAESALGEIWIGDGVVVPSIGRGDPTIGARTLPSGVWRVGLTGIVSPGTKGTLTIDYGVTRCIQTGLVVQCSSGDLEGLGLTMNARLPLGAMAGLGLSISTSWFRETPIGREVQGSVAFSCALGSRFVGHAGVRGNCGGVGADGWKPYVAIEFVPSPRSSLAVEAELPPRVVTLSAHFRTTGSLGVRLALRPGVTPSLLVGVDIHAASWVRGVRQQT